MIKKSMISAVCFVLLLLTLPIRSVNSQPASAGDKIVNTNMPLGTPLADGQSKFLGCAYSSVQDRNFTSYWNQVTPENAGKWGSAEGVRDGMNWSGLDAAYNLAKNNGFPFRFHVLIWGNQQPGWIETLSESEQLEEIEEWFAAVAEEYPDIDYLEVVNEPLHDPPNQPGSGGGNYMNALGGSNDLYGTGWDWVIKAFELARHYFPSSTKLMINDFGIVSSASATTQYLQIINLLKERNLIDGIGVQGHAFSTRGSASTMRNNLDRLAETGLSIQVTEMDVDGPTDEIQLDDYRRIFPAFWEHPGVEGITLWGWRPGCWRDAQGAYIIDLRGAERPALQWLRSYIIGPKAPKLVSPGLNATGVPRDPELTWQPSDSATSYGVQLATSGRVTTVVLDTAVTDTFLQVYSLEANEKYIWRVNASNDLGTSEYSAYANFVTGEQFVTGLIDDEDRKPLAVQLFQNYPNPFNPVTQIPYSVPARNNVSIKIFNHLGQEIAILFEGIRLAGNYIELFNGTGLADGVYFCRLEADGFIETKKLILLK